MNYNIAVWEEQYRKDLLSIYYYLQHLDSFFKEECNYSKFVEFCYKFSSHPENCESINILYRIS